jgi:probable HAF family extracellular repeat protein
MQSTENTVHSKLNTTVATRTLCAARASPALSIKSRALTWFLVITGVATLAISLPLAAQGSRDRNQGHHHYKLVDLGTFGGPAAYYESDPPETIISAKGTVAVAADTLVADPYCVTDCYVVRAFLWHDGIRSDLNSLLGGYSSFPYSINTRGQTVGESENGNVDPLTGSPEFSAVLWNRGPSPSVLGTLGGNQSVANAINDRGQVVGAALNAVLDPLANAFSVPYLFVPAATQARAFLWTEAKGMEDLGTLGGPDSTAVFVNQHGQVAGQSYTNTIINPATSVPTQDPFFWENGEMVDIGSLGGNFGTAQGMNNRGQVIGQSNLAGNQTHHAFLWDKSRGLRDLGTLPGYAGASEAHWINDAGEVVGESIATLRTGSRAFLWKDGVMIDLGTVADDTCSAALSINSRGQIVGFGAADCRQEDHAFLAENGGPIVDLATLVLRGAAVTMIEGIFINDRGEIAVRGKLSNGDEHALVLLPCDEDHRDVKGCDYSLTE